MHDFEYDTKKSDSNLKKHGIDFVTAQELWLDPELIEIQAKSDDESRFLVIAERFETLPTIPIKSGKGAWLV
jgi:uncharacterized DUF497 family protein